MTYTNRKHPITWTSPSGKSFELNNISEVSYSFKHYGNLTTIANSKEKDNSLSFLVGNTFDTTKGDIFEDLGISGKTIPLQIIFSGDNHDKESEVFERAFAEIGHSKLKLPYNDRPLRVNAQTLDKKQDLIKDIASTIIDVEFIETLQNKPLGQNNRNAKNELKDNLETEKVNNANNFSNTIKKLPVDKLQNVYDSFSKNLTKIANTFNNITTGDFDAVLRDIQANILGNSDNILFQQASKLIDLGFEAVSSAPYINTLLKNIVNDLKGNDKTTKEELITNDFFISATLLSACSSLTDIDIETKKESFQTAVNLQNIYEDYKQYYDNTQKNLNLSLENSFTTSSNINHDIQNTAGLLIETSFDLKTEFNITLAEDSNLIDIAYRYYKEEFRENQNKIIDYIVKSNSISDEEFILI